MKSLTLIALSLSLTTALSINSNSAEAQQLKDDTNTVKAALGKVDLDYGAAFSRNDSLLFLNCYAEDAAIMPPGLPVLAPKKAKLTFFRTAYKFGVRNIVFTEIGVFGLTDQFVTEQGKFEMLDGSQNSMGKGKFLVLWKKTPDGWKMFRDAFSDDSKAGLGRGD